MVCRCTTICISDMDEKDYINALFTLLFNADTNMKNGQSQVTFDELEYQRNCPNVYWVQDMSQNLPFCNLDNEFCNCQCRHDS